MDEGGERNAGCSGQSTSYYASSRVRRRKSHGRKILRTRGSWVRILPGPPLFNDLAAKTKSSFLLWDRCGTTYPPVRADLNTCRGHELLLWGGGAFSKAAARPGKLSTNGFLVRSSQRSDNVP